MDSQKKPISPWIKAFIIAIIFLITLSCLVEELITMEVSDIRTATSKAKDTAEATLYNSKTATAIRSITETAMAPKPPVITGIKFPSEIPGNKSTIIGLLYFTDPDGDIQYVRYDVVSAKNFSGGVDNDPKLNSGNWNDGAIKVYIWCDGQQDVTLRATLYDFAGNQDSVYFSFTCK